MPMKMSDIHSEIQAGILNYLSIHPGAAGSVAEISSNWLADENVAHNLEQVQTAVDRLVDHGELHKSMGTNLYTL
ncbi:hypothetical protein ND16A_1851 [Thalassotalea sp. ND16A]|nr:hypothetical protein ND16A_1851 [Thalassotalea sp. ND16A]